MATVGIHEHRDNVRRALKRHVYIGRAQEFSDGFRFEVSKGTSIFSSTFVVVSYDDGSVEIP